jgi:hypothetical protein
MLYLLKLATLLLVFGIISCELDPYLFSRKWGYCLDDSKNLGNNLKFGTYTGSNYTIIVNENNEEFAVSVKETLFLREDSTFAYFAVTNNNDTIKKISNGNFKIYQDTGFLWYVLELKSDSIYEKAKIDTNEFRDFSISGRSITLTYLSDEANLLSNIDNESDCFSLAYKYNPHNNPCDPDYDCCDKMVLIKEKTFCLRQPEEIQTL